VGIAVAVSAGDGVPVAIAVIVGAAGVELVTGMPVGVAVGAVVLIGVGV